MMAAWLLLAGATPPAAPPAAPSPSPPGSAAGRFGAWFAAAAARTGVPLPLLRAVAWAESGDQPAVVSRAGAIGVMQLMPGTAAALGVNPWDPAQNIVGGATYLADQLRQFGGNVSLALAAYNAGPEAVDAAGGIPPYPETQAYVRTVEALAARYAAGDGP